MDMSKYRGMFLSETGEHLRSMSRQIVELEANPADREAIDSLFRAAHSVKGMAASMGFEHTAELAHRLEDLLDGFRKSGEVPAVAVDRLLAGVDLLEGLLEDITAEREERAIDAFLAAGAAPAVPPPPPVAAAAPEADLDDWDFTETSAAAPPILPPVDPAPPPETLLQVVLELVPDASAPAARGLLALRELAGLGRLHSSAPTETQLREGLPLRRLEALVETAHPATLLQQRLQGMSDVAQVTVLPALTPPVERDGGARRDESRSVRVKTELLDRFVNLTGELITTRYMLQANARDQRWRETREGIDLLTRLINDLHQHVLQVRMMPLESITGRLPRVVRDLARKSGKEIQLQIDGEELELDRAILEQLADPLVHMTRNAVDHGIEHSGKIVIRAWREKDLALIEVADNGRGIDPQRVLQKALERGAVSSAQSKTLREHEILQLICLPGFSTAAAVTETSGRGVGMDVVKAAVESLGGILEIDSAPGAGTRFLLKLPLTIAIIQVLLAACAGHSVAVPITRVQRVLDLNAADIGRSGHQRVLAFEGGMIPLLHLNQLLELPEPPLRGSIPAIVTESRGRRTALMVERLLGQREAFVKAPAFPLDRIGGLGGAFVTGDGNVVFIIDPLALLETGTPNPLPLAAGE